MHERTLTRYNASYETMSKSCEILYQERKKAIELIQFVEKVVNSIANTPKEYDTKVGEIHREVEAFCNTEKYAQEAYAASIKAGTNIVGGVAVGAGIAAMAPTALMSVATTFGTAATGTAISTLAGAAAQKSAVAWIGRTFVGFAVKSGTAGMAAGNAFLALAGPVGWGITAASVGVSVLSLNKKNKEVAEQAINEAKEIAKAREALDETTEKVRALKEKTSILYEDLNSAKEKIVEFMNVNYSDLVEDRRMYLGTIVNNTLSLSALINKTL